MPATIESPKEIGDVLDIVIAAMRAGGISYSTAIQETRKRFITKVLQEFKGNQFVSAKELGMHRNTLARAIAELQINVSQCKPHWQEPKPVRRQELHTRSAAAGKLA